MSLSHHVFFEDDYADNGGIGIQHFATQAEAMSFIEDRLAQNHKRNLACYTYINGEIIPLETAALVTKVRPKQP